MALRCHPERLLAVSYMRDRRGVWCLWMLVCVCVLSDQSWCLTHQPLTTTTTTTTTVTTTARTGVAEGGDERRRGVDVTADCHCQLIIHWYTFSHRSKCQLLTLICTTNHASGWRYTHFTDAQFAMHATGQLCRVAPRQGRPCATSVPCIPSAGGGGLGKMRS